MSGRPLIDDGHLVVRSVHNRIFSVVGMLAGAGICALFVTGASSTAVVILALVVGLAMLAGAARAVVIGVVADAEALHIRELTRTRRLTWPQVSEVTSRKMSRTISAPLFVLNEVDQRGRLRVQARCLASHQPMVVQRFVDRLETHRVRMSQEYG